MHLINPNFLVHRRFVGLARSGNHAIILWVLNNIAQAEPLGGQAYHDPVTKKYIYFNNVSRAGYRGFWGRIKEYDELIYSYEDEIPEPDSYVLICRDFLNLFASRQKKFCKTCGQGSKGYVTGTANLVDHWIRHHELNKPKIYYNFWLYSKTYRDLIAEAIGIENSVDNTEKVSTIGEGSSFIGMNLDKTEAYLSRWRLINFDAEDMEIILSNKKLIDMNKEIYKIDIEKCLKENNGKKT